MAWTAPMTAVAGATFTASQFNQYVRDNLNETAPAKATSDAQFFVSTGPNALAARQLAQSNIITRETTTSPAYTDLTTIGPRVTVNTSSRALVMFAASLDNSSATSASKVSVAVSGATTIAADDRWCLDRDSATAASIWRIGAAHLFDTLTAGSNTFTMKYAATSNTGGFANRELIVLPF